MQLTPTKSFAHRASLLALTISLVLSAPPYRISAQSQNVCNQSTTIQSGDTLSSLANRYLGSYSAYQSIVNATNAAAEVDPSYATIQNAARINIGWKVCITTSEAANAGTTENISPSTRLTTATSTAAPTVAPAVSRLPNVAATPATLHPLTIAAMRIKIYPGSQMVIEQSLAANANYSRYVASYYSDGNNVFGLLTVPNGRMPQDGWPLILFNHGYIDPAIYRTTERYVAYQDAFARNGYVTFKSDYRGHGFSEGSTDIETNQGGNRHAAYTSDVLNALSSLKLRTDVDADKIGMWGHSMGGQITLRAMVISNEVKAGSIWAGTVADYATMWDRWEDRTRANPQWSSRIRNWRAELVADYGTPEENPAFWSSISPNAYVDDLSGAVLLQHATGDSIVPVAYSDIVNTEIEAVGGEVSYFRYIGDDHNLSANLSVALARDVTFFDAVLK